MNILYKTVIFMFLLNTLYGCAKSTPTENIIDGHIEHINQTLDYAYNNIDQTLEVKYLEDELESCVVALNSAKQSYYAEIDKCESETDYWRLASVSLFVLLMLGVFAKIKRII